MTSIAFILVLTGVLLNACAQLLLKAGTNAVGHFEFSASNIMQVLPKFIFEWHILGGLMCYAISVVVWIGALSRTPVSVAYPMLSIGYVVNAIAAWYLFGEALTITRITGIVVIIAGVYLITRS
jgi:multidrug transporter EmrE-like cation transporter